MNSDAILACFREGASLGSLAQALGVPPVQVEQMVRESLRPRTATTSTPAPSSSPAPRAGRRAAKRSVEKPRSPRSRRQRRSREAVREAVIRALATPGTKQELMQRSETTNGTLLRELLDELVAEKRVSKSGPQYAWLPHPARASA